MRDVSLGRKYVFWGALCAIILLAVVPSMMLIEKTKEYVGLLWTFDQASLRQLKTRRIPHRDVEPPRGQPDIRFIEFSVDAPRAKEVTIAGSFNQWDPKATALQRSRSGRWKSLIPLPPGTHYYAFVVDGTWTLDPGAPKAEVAGREASVRQLQ